MKSPRNEDIDAFEKVKIIRVPHRAAGLGKHRFRVDNARWASAPTSDPGSLTSTLDRAVIRTVLSRRRVETSDGVLVEHIVVEPLHWQREDEC
jgi:predicted NAD-dependent protein-ADP-ribosyltransferase YbiA (DUF1768 family)